MNAEQLIEHIANNKLSDLEVNYPNGLVVEKGKMLPMIGTQREPEVKFPFDSHYHTLLMIDTDAPSKENPSNSDYIHWAIANVPPKGNLDDGETMADYLGPAPPHGTGFHRYFFLLLEHDEPFKTENFGTRRPKFDRDQYIHKHGLKTTAANWFRTKQD